MKLKSFSLPEWDMMAGESKIRTVTLRNENTGRPYNLEGSTAVLTIVDFVNYASDTLVRRNVKIRANSDGIFCLCDLVLVPEDTKGEHGKYIYQITITDEDGHISKPRGVLYINYSAED